MEMILDPHDMIDAASPRARTLDWQGLAARLCAAAACREALSATPRRQATMGSFDPDAARRLARFSRGEASAGTTWEYDRTPSSTPVNRVDLGERKTPPAIEVVTPAMQRPVIEV